MKTLFLRPHVDPHPLRVDAENVRHRRVVVLYKPDVVAHTDFRKLDGLLRLVLTGGGRQRAKLEAFLQKRTLEKTIRYGLHVSRSAIMTCLVSDRQHDHVHFVDASGGGYAEAARKMKQESKQV